MNLWFSVYTVHETLVLNLYVSNNRVEYFDILDPNLVHYTAYLRTTLEKLFSCLYIWKWKLLLFSTPYIFFLLLSFIL